jgi:hypothetical protein
MQASATRACCASRRAARRGRRHRTGERRGAGARRVGRRPLEREPAPRHRTLERQIEALSEQVRTLQAVGDPGPGPDRGPGAAACRAAAAARLRPRAGGLGAGLLSILQVADTTPRQIAPRPLMTAAVAAFLPRWRCTPCCSCGPRSTPACAGGGHRRRHGAAGAGGVPHDAGGAAIPAPGGVELPARQPLFNSEDAHRACS